MSTLSLPPKLDPDALPRWLSRRQMVEVHVRYYGPISERSIKQWPLQWRFLNGRSIAPTEDFLAEARRRLAEAPRRRRGPINIADAA